MSSVGLAEVGLQGHAQVRVLPELRVGPQAPVELERDVLEPPHLRVDAEEAAEGDDRPIQGLEACEHPLDRSFDVGRVRQREQRRRLHRDVDAGRMAPVEDAPRPPERGPRASEPALRRPAASGSRRRTRRPRAR